MNYKSKSRSIKLQYRGRQYRGKRGFQKEDYAGDESIRYETHENKNYILED